MLKDEMTVFGGNNKFDKSSTLSEKYLASISLKSNLGFSLKNSLSKVSKDILMNDIFNALVQASQVDYYLSYRIKSLQSCLIKYNKNIIRGNSIKSTFNDLLNFRIIVDDYNIKFPSYCRVVDMVTGKKDDDGYRGIHLYYQLDNYHYPIEIQLSTKRDRFFANLAHKHLYKYKDNYIGIYLRNLFDNGKINNENDFIKELGKIEKSNFSEEV